MFYQNSSKGKEESALLRQRLSRGIPIIFGLKSLLSLVKIPKCLQIRTLTWHLVLP